MTHLLQQSELDQDSKASHLKQSSEPRRRWNRRRKTLAHWFHWLF